LSDRPSPAEDVAAAVACARDLGLGPIEPQVLKLAHHTSVRLSPWPIVARVDSSAPLERILPFMRRELDVAQHLARADAPAVRPSIDPPPGPHVQGRAAITFWTYVEHRPAAGKTDIAAAGAALRELHAALSTYPGDLPLFTAGLDTCACMLADPHAIPALGDRPRRFLIDRMQALRSGLSLEPAQFMPVHGDAHAGNILVTPAGPIWADLETVGLAPLEWELTNLPPAGRVHFRSLDRALLERLSLLRSLSVAVWCWADADRSAEVRAAAEYHLRRLRRRKLV
jgi:Phosphotransferase enzyme family